MIRYMWLFLPALLLLPALTGCSADCSNMPITQIDAPGGEHSAVLFRRDCGATTSFSTQLSVLRTGEDEQGSGNAFRADADHGATALGEWDGPWAEISWLASDHLLVRYAERSRIFRQKDEVSGVRITYEPAAP